MTIDNIALRAEELAGEGITVKVIRAHLTIEGFGDKEITAALKKAGISGGKKRGFAAEFYDWLAECPRDMAEVEAYVLGLGVYEETSKNVQNHLSHYKNIAELANRIWVSKEVADEDDADMDALMDEA